MVCRALKMEAYIQPTTKVFFLSSCLLWSLFDAFVDEPHVLNSFHILTKGCALNPSLFYAVLIITGGYMYFLLLFRAMRCAMGTHHVDVQHVVWEERSDNEGSNKCSRLSFFLLQSTE
ncbi:hypothetical protein V8C37DRAFT_377818 [Trichoderma ceciliae]